MAGRRGTENLPASDWAKIVDRRLRGEALATIARDYHCSARQIGQVTRRFRRRFRSVANGLGRVSPGLGSVDPALASRLAGITLRFLTTLDTTMDQRTEANILALRESTDQLMRVVARVRIELVRAAPRGRR